MMTISCFVTRTLVLLGLALSLLGQQAAASSDMCFGASLRFRHDQQKRQLQESPVELAEAWLEADPNLDTYSEERRAQRLALAIFYYATDGDNWIQNTGWLSYDTNECEWYSRADPVCDEEGRYLALHLNANGLSGTIPPEIGSLSVLTLIEISRNNLNGEIPPTIGSVESIEYLNLASNDLTGSIPIELTNLADMNRFGLSNNQLTGVLPTGVGLLTR